MPPDGLLAIDSHRALGHRITNMKRTLAHSAPSFRALMEWYPLRAAVEPFLGPRLTNLFAHAISTRADCLVCSTFFRRILIEAGEEPDRLELDAREACVVEFGRQLATDPHTVAEDLYRELAGFMSPDQIVALTAFGALMLATNVFNNALEVPLDEYLIPYKKRVGVSDG